MTCQGHIISTFLREDKVDSKNFQDKPDIVFLSKIGQIIKQMAY